MTWKHFKHWWINVFWYHYGKAALVTLCVVLLMFLIVREAANRIKPDFTYVVVTNFHVDGERLSALTEFFTGVSHDINGDGIVLINAITINMTDPETIPQERLLISYLDQETYIYIIDQPNVNFVLSNEVLEDLTPLAEEGFEIYRGHLIRIDHIPMVRQAFRLRDNQPLYIGLKMPPLNANDLDFTIFAMSATAMFELLEFGG
jgi:hypothetical protein